MVQTRLQIMAQANAPAVQSTKPVMRKATPKIARIPIKTGKEKASKPPPSGVDQQLPEGIVISMGA